MLSEILHDSNRDTAECSDPALPLLKVLSIRSALCLQLHPDRPLAEQLHVKYPSRYPGISDSEKFQNILYIGG